jgi:hypothetical protein
MSVEGSDFVSEQRPMSGAPEDYTYNYDVFTWNWMEVAKRGVKYLIEGLAIALVAYYLLHKKLDSREIAILAVTAALVFAILDTFSPTVAYGARFGAGFGIGQTMFGLPGIVI